MTTAPRHRIFVGKDVHKFSSAHMTVFPDGTKERIHGHNFQVSTAFALKHTNFGTMLDFALVKQMLVAQCAAWDQRLILADRCPLFEKVRQADGELEFKLCGKRYIVPADEVVLLPLTNIVVETLAEAFAGALAQRLGDALSPDLVEWMEVTVSESTNQGGAYVWSVGA